MGKIRCLNCSNELNMISSAACPACGARLSHVKIAFLAYLGPEDSLAGYQRSYKLVLLKSIYQEFQSVGFASARAVTDRFRSYYLNRIQQGLPADKDVDSRISNILNSSPEDVFDVIKTNPFQAISRQGFLRLRGDGINGTFELQRDLGELSDNEITALYDLLSKKLRLYYEKIGLPIAADESDAPQTQIEQQNMDEPAADNYACTEPAVPPNYQTTPIEALSLNTRAYNALKRNGIDTLAQLIDASEKDILGKLKNVGANTAAEITAVLARIESGQFRPCAQSEDIAAEDSIEACFSENAFVMFRTYCKNNHITKLSDLEGFDFDALSAVRGFGIGKIENVRNRYLTLSGISSSSYQSPKSTAKDRPFAGIHSSNLGLDIDILRFWDITPKTVRDLKEHGFAVLKNISEADEAVLQASVGYQKYPDLKVVLRKFFDPLSALASEILDECAQDKSFDIYVRRAEGDSLQEIGSKYTVTRERIRQICSKFEQKIQPVVLALAADIEKGNGVSFFTGEQILSVFDNDRYEKVIIFSLKNCPDYDYIDFADTFVRISVYPDAEENLCRLAGEIVGDGINLFEKIDEIESALENSGYSFMTADSFIDLLIKYKYRFYGDIVVKGKKSYGLLGAEIVAEAFPAGIHTDDGPQLRNLLLQKYGQLDLPDNNRAFMARVCTFLVQCGRSTYIAPQNIMIDSSVLNDIKQFIDDSSQRDLYYTEIFSQFEGLLQMTSNVDNAAFLHGVLLQYFPFEYTYSRDYLSKKTGEDAVCLSDRVSQVLLRAGHALRKKDILSEIPGISEVMLFNAVMSSDALIQWEYGLYNDIRNLQLDQNEIAAVEQILEMQMSINDGYCSERMLYENVQAQLSDILLKAGIANAQNLFYTVSAFFTEKYEFRRPHIARHGRFSETTAKEIILEFLEHPILFDANEYQSLVNQFLWPEVTSGILLSQIENDYVRISKNQYIKKDSLFFSQEDIRYICSQIGWAAGDSWYLPLQVFIDSEETLPNGMDVNEFLIGSAVELAVQDWVVVYPQAKDRRYQRGILVKADRGIFSYDALIAQALLEAGLTEVSEAKLLAFLQIHQLTYKVIPKELWSAEHIWFENDLFHIN